MKKRIIFIILLSFVLSASSFAQNISELLEKADQALSDNNFKKAARYYYAAYSQKPDNEQLKILYYRARGLDFFDEKKYEQAVENLEKAYNVNTNNEILKHEIAYVYSHFASDVISSGDAMEASNIMEKALFYEKNDGQLYELAGDIAYTSNDLEKAQEYWTKASNLLPLRKSEIEVKIKKTQKENILTEGFLQKKKSYFDIYFPREKRYDYVSRVSYLLEQARGQIPYKYNMSTQHVIPVIIYAGGQFADVTETTGKVQGLYDGKIRVSEQDISQSDDKLKQIIFHEYAHAVLSSNSKYAPIWFQEGFAQNNEPIKGVSSQELMFVKDVLKNDNSFHIDKVNQLFISRPDDNSVSFAYIISELFYEFLIKKYQKHRIILIINKMDHVTDYKQAFEEVLYVPFDRIEAEFWKNL